jgi:haloalkane dehalogenase
VIELPDWIEAQLPAGARHDLIDVGDRMQMHVAEWGPVDGKPVLLVHGNPTWSFLWRKVIAAVLAKNPRLRLIAPDLVGLGLSSKPDAGAHTIENHAKWLGRVIDDRTDGKLVVVAQDWGGPISLHAMASRRDRLAGLVLGNTAVSPPREGFKPTLFHRLAQLPVVSTLLFRELGFPLGVLHMSQSDRSSIRGDVARAYRWPLRKRADRAAPLALARMVPDSQSHPSVPALRVTEELFRTVEVPISIVWGTKDPVLGRVINHLERMRPDAKVVRSDRAGHFLQEEVPDLLADALLSIAT